MRSLGVISGVALLGCLLACGGGGPPPAAPARKAVPRAELKNGLWGEKADEVVRRLGKPESTSERGGHAVWTYRGVALDPVTGKVDAETVIHFGPDGRVNQVDF